MSKKPPKPKKGEKPSEETEVSADGAEGAEGEGAPAKKKPPMMIIIAAAAVVLLGGGGGAGYFLFLKPKPAANGEEHAAAEKKPKKKEEKKEEGGKEDPNAPVIKEGPDGVVFYTLPDLLVNMQSPDGRPTFLKLKLTLELPDCRGNERNAQLCRHIIDDQPRREIVAAIDDNVRVAQQSLGIVGVQPLNDRDHFYMRIESCDRLHCGLGLGAADIFAGET